MKMMNQRNEYDEITKLVRDFYTKLDEYVEFCNDKPGDDWRRIEGYQVLSNDMLNVLRQDFINILVQFNDIAGATNRPVMNPVTGHYIIF